MPRTLVIDTITDIDGWGFTFESVVRQLKNFKGDEIIVPINSYGGDVLNGIGIYNILRGRKERVTARIISYAMSMGTAVAMGADVVEMPENGFFMVHDPSAGRYGTSEDMEKAAALLTSVKEELVSIYHRKTGLPKEQISDLMAEETWLTAQEAFDLGFVDKLTEGVRLAAKFDPSKGSDLFKNIPQELIQSENQMSDNTFLNSFAKVFGGDSKDENGAGNDGKGANGDGVQGDGNSTPDQYEELSNKIENSISSLQDTLTNAFEGVGDKIRDQIAPINQATQENGQKIEEISDSVQATEGRISDLEKSIQDLQAENKALKMEMARKKAGNGQGSGDGNYNPSDGNGLDDNGAGSQFEAKVRRRAKNATEYGKNAKREE